MQHYRSIVAFIIAVLLVAPSVYSGLLPTQRAQAQDIGDITVAAATAAATSYAACTLAGWIQGWLSSVLPWLSVEAAATTGSVGTAATASEVPAAVSAGLALIPATTAAGLATHVPVADPFVVTAIATNNAIDAAVAVNTAASAQSSTVDAVNSGSLTFKECVLDPLLWAIRDAFLQAITNDIIQWIEGGFEGSPAFLRDPEDFFKGIADTVLQDYLYNSGLDQFLCEPFRLDVVFGISLDYNKPAAGNWGRLSCSLDDIFPGVAINIDIDGDGTPDTTVAGPTGTQAHDQMTNNGDVWDYSIGLQGAGGLGNSSNNIMGSQLETRDSLAGHIAAQQAESGMKLDLGKGWFSLQCDTDGDGQQDGTCTPGEYVANAIDNYSNNALTELTIADEFAEILNALFSALVKNLLQEAGVGGTGLLNWTRTD